MTRAVSAGTTTALLLAGCWLWASQPPATEPSWHTDYAKALAESRQSGKPIFALFH